MIDVPSYLFLCFQPLRPSKTFNQAPELGSKQFWQVRRRCARAAPNQAGAQRGYLLLSLLKFSGYGL